jgi:hypothetical protein
MESVGPEVERIRNKSLSAIVPAAEFKSLVLNFIINKSIPLLLSVGAYKYSAESLADEH